MELADFELLPSVIDSTDDPKHLGRVKCTIPGITDNSMVCEDNMPWVYPLAMSSYQHFSNPMKGQKVWVLVDKNDNKNLWYIPLFEYINITEEFVKDEYNKNAEVIIARNLGGQKAMITYDDDNGIVLTLRNSKVHIKQDGDIEIKSNDSNVRISGGIVFCGTENKGYEPAIYGQKLTDMLDNLSKAIGHLNELAGNCFTAHLQPAILEMQNALSNTTSLKCTNTKVN